MIKRHANARVEKRENMRGGAGTVTVTHFFEKDDFGAPVRLCSRLVLPPGAGIGPHSHENEDEIFIITAGSGILNDGVSDSRVSAGDAILTGKGGSHSIRNDGNKDLEIDAVIVCYR